MMKLNEVLVINNVGKYSGYYVEDGSFDEVKDVLVMEVENMGDQVIFEADIQASVNGKTYDFFLSLLPAKSKCLILEKNRQTIEGTVVEMNFSLNDISYYDEPLHLQEDVLSVKKDNGCIWVTNKTNEMINDMIYVFYKSVDDTTYLGGRTFCHTINGIKPLEKVGLPIMHSSASEYDIIHVEIAENEDEEVL